MHLDLIAVVGEPGFPRGIEPVARPVVDDQEDLPSPMLLDESLKEHVERVAVEDVRELVGELWFLLQRDCAVDVRGLA